MDVSIIWIDVSILNEMMMFKNICVNLNKFGFFFFFLDLNYVLNLIFLLVVICVD